VIATLHDLDVRRWCDPQEPRTRSSSSTRSTSTSRSAAQVTDDPWPASPRRRSSAAPGARPARILEEVMLEICTSSHPSRARSAHHARGHHDHERRCWSPKPTNSPRSLSARGTSSSSPPDRQPRGRLCAAAPRAARGRPDRLEDTRSHARVLSHFDIHHADASPLRAQQARPRPARSSGAWPRAHPSPSSTDAAHRDLRPGSCSCATRVRPAWTSSRARPSGSHRALGGGGAGGSLVFDVPAGEAGKRLNR